MIIDNQLLDQVSGQAKESERLRMNFNLHETLDAKAQRLLNALEVGTVLPIHRHRHTAETYPTLFIVDSFQVIKTDMGTI